MSIFEVLVFFAFAGVGGFAYYLYRQDARPRAPGEKAPVHPKGQRMFERTPQNTSSDKK
jgi:hypothetical protein